MVLSDLGGCAIPAARRPGFSDLGVPLVVAVLLGVWQACRDGALGPVGDWLVTSLLVRGGVAAASMQLLVLRA